MLGAAEWATPPPYQIENVADALDRAARDEADHLAVRAPSGEPLALGGADHENPRGPGMLRQLSTHEALRSLGIGTILIRALEDRCRLRGLDATRLAVETDNPRARALYERLGDETLDEATEGWEQPDHTGSTSRYETRVILMHHRLQPAGSD